MFGNGSFAVDNDLMYLDKNGDVPLKSQDAVKIWWDIAIEIEILYDSQGIILESHQPGYWMVTCCIYISEMNQTVNSLLWIRLFSYRL